jgi:hypothetical protein
MITCTRLLIGSSEPAAAPSSASRLTRLVELVGEFPQLELALARQPCASGVVAVEASEWSATDDLWVFDRAMNVFEHEDGALDIVGRPDAVAPVALEVLTRYQRWTDRRNHASRTSRFDAVLARHRAMHDLSNPEDKADYDRGLDVWRWLLRLAPEAGLALQAAALFHEAANAAARSELTARTVTAAGVDELTAKHAGRLIEQAVRHSADGSASAEVVTLCDAVALSFFSSQSARFTQQRGPALVRTMVRHYYDRMSPEAKRRLDTIKMRCDVSHYLAAERHATRTTVGLSS